MKETTYEDKWVIKVKLKTGKYAYLADKLKNKYIFYTNKPEYMLICRDEIAANIIGSRQTKLNAIPVKYKEMLSNLKENK